ncbi:cytochrome b5 domain-containing protein 1 [Nasonia vitripennis]|uniref:Cytochrome b5 domain-containing protein 1 n=1 Tax=Nasonia vitripennis TaxID=7425 RepID=A0A7M7QB49_NASVI|nr:cytochrome b5 domain-containing protein 1 [Nasonia vitripennis]
MSAREFPYFLPSEVALHKRPENCWLSCLGDVYELSEYVTRNSESPISQYLVGHAGKDASHWFDARGRLRRYVEPRTGRRQILLPFASPKPELGDGMSKPLHQPAAYGCCARYLEPGHVDDHSRLEATELTGKCWLELECLLSSRRYRRGRLTKKPRTCSITNVLTSQRAVITVCEEDSIGRIQERASIFNRHIGSYTCKFEGKLLQPAWSLTENGIAALESDSYLGSAGITYVPNLLCYFNDDLTEM